ALRPALPTMQLPRARSATLKPQARTRPARILLCSWWNGVRCHAGVEIQLAIVVTAGGRSVTGQEINHIFIVAAAYVTFCWNVSFMRKNQCLLPFFEPSASSRPKLACYLRR